MFLTVSMLDCTQEVWSDDGFSPKRAVPNSREYEVVKGREMELRQHDVGINTRFEALTHPVIIWKYSTWRCNARDGTVMGPFPGWQSQSQQHRLR